MSTSSLATIMFTDLVDSTGQRSRIGDDAADAIAAAHDRIVADAAGHHGGRVVKTLGDGALSIYPSALDAVEAGIAICEAARGHVSADSSAEGMSVRVGIHAGEVATADGDVSGLPVAVASRVCGVAEGGQVVVTSLVRSLLGSRGDMTLHPLGTRRLKGVPDPMELWVVGGDVVVEPADAGGAVPFPPFLARGIPAALVGRDEELASLDAAHAHASGGRTTFVAVVGEPGIGKTALTSTWTRSVADRGGTVLGGRCTPDAAVPYQPFIEIARSVLDARPGRLADLGPAAGNVAMLVPGVPTPPGLPSPIQADGDTIQYLMSEAFVALMTPGPDEPATVVVLDDLHWADDASIGVLAHLARLDDPRPIVLIGTYRDTDLVRSHPLPRLLADLRRERRIDRIVLDALDSDEIAAMVVARVGHAIDSQVIASIATETKGNPFFVAEMVAHLLDEGAIDATGAWVSDVPIEEYGIPEGVRDVIGRRIERLGEDAAPLFEVASVMGPTFRVDLAGEVADLAESMVDEVIDRAIAAGVITEGDTVDEAAFSHALVRQTIYDELSARRRIRLHRSVAEALHEAGAPAIETLPHWLAAGDSEHALPAAIRAASEARSAAVQIDAMRHLELAVDLWDDVDDPEALTGTTHADLVMDLSVTWGDFSLEPTRGMELIDREIAAGSSDPVIMARLYARKSEHLWQLGDIAGSDEFVTKALDTIPHDPLSGELAVLQSYKAGRLMTSGRYRSAIDAARIVLDMVEALGGDAPFAAEMRAVVVLGTANLSIGNVAEGEAWFERLRELAETSGSVRASNTRYMNQGEGYRVNGRYDDALALFREGIEASREIGADRWVTALTGNTAQVLTTLGRWEEAGEALDALPEHGELDFPELGVVGKRMLLAAERGEQEVYVHQMDRLAGYDVANQEQQVNAEIYEAMVAHLRWEGRLDEAYEVAVEAMDGWADIPDLTEACHTAAYGVGVVADAFEAGTAREGWLDSARAWHARLEQSETPDAYAAVWKAVAAAELARAEGRDDPELWRTALSETSDRPYIEAIARWRLARALRKIDPEDSEVPELLARARTIADSLGARPLLAALDA